MNAPHVEIRTVPAPDVELPSVPETALCDTCCGVPVVVAFALSDRIVLLAGDMLVHSHEHRWLACRWCELLVDARDIDGLIARARSAAMVPDPEGLVDRLNATAYRLMISKTQVVHR